MHGVTFFCLFHQCSVLFLPSGWRSSSGGSFRSLALYFLLFSLFNIWQVWHFTIQCFHWGVEHSLRYFPANLLFFISRKPTSSGSRVLIFSLLSLAWSPCAKVLVCALMESHCCGDWDSCSRTSLLRGLQTSQESNEENWELWGKLRAAWFHGFGICCVKGSYGSIGDDGLILILNTSKIFCVIKPMVVMFAPLREGHKTPLEPSGWSASGSWTVISKRVW